ncbi:MAG: alkaline shock response membrane anchor protein AmaP [Clostridia bacterium]|nr:alkaline shock response membrane anchor protein AmaP [Clostridia bacterium]
MAALRRVLLAFWGLLCAAVAVLLAVMLVNTRLAFAIIDVLDKYLLYNMTLSFLEDSGIWMVIVIGLVLLAFGVFCLIVALAPKRVVKKLRVATVEGGAVDISISALQSVVKKAALANADVQTVESKLLVKNNGLHVLLNIAVPDGISVPEVGNQVREEVKTQLEAMAGIAPAEVRVIITAVLDKKEEDNGGGNG